jgi:hypothetical protein
VKPSSGVLRNASILTDLHKFDARVGICVLIRQSFPEGNSHPILHKQCRTQHLGAGLDSHEVFTRDLNILAVKATTAEFAPEAGSFKIAKKSYLPDVVTGELPLPNSQALMQVWKKYHT